MQVDNMKSWTGNGEWMTMATNSKKRFRLIVPVIMLALVMFMTSSCGGSPSSDGEQKAGGPFVGKETSDLSAYSSMEGYGGESRLVETTVAEAVKLYNDKESFILFFSYADCEYCNCIMPYVNEIAEEEDMYVGYVNTRSNPDWASNIDIDDYDLFVKYFGDYLQEDENGIKHLYTPDIYCIKDGKVTARHDGVIPGEEIDPAQPLTSSQQETLKKTLKEKFETIK